MNRKTSVSTSILISRLLNSAVNNYPLLNFSHLLRGRSKIFSGGGGGAKDYVRTCTSQARSPNSLMAVLWAFAKRLPISLFGNFIKIEKYNWPWQFLKQQKNCTNEYFPGFIALEVVRQRMLSPRPDRWRGRRYPAWNSLPRGLTYFVNSCICSHHVHMVHLTLNCLASSRCRLSRIFSFSCATDGETFAERGGVDLAFLGGVAVGVAGSSGGRGSIPGMEMSSLRMLPLLVRLRPASCFGAGQRTGIGWLLGTLNRSRLGGRAGVPEEKHKNIYIFVIEMIKLFL